MHSAARPSSPLSPPAFYVSITLAGLLTLGAMLSATATVREATGLMAAVSFLGPQSCSHRDGIKGWQGCEPREPAAPVVSP